MKIRKGKQEHPSAAQQPAAGSKRPAPLAQSADALHEVSARGSGGAAGSEPGKGHGGLSGSYPNQGAKKGIQPGAARNRT